MTVGEQNAQSASGISSPSAPLRVAGTQIFVSNFQYEGSIVETNFRRDKISIAVSCALLSLCSPGIAADNDPKATDAKQTEKIETVSVVAENPKGYRAKTVQVGAFRDQEILDVPLTVNVITRAVLDAQDSRGVYDALRNASGVSRAQLNGNIYDNLAIRGVAIQNRTNFRLNGSLPIVNLIDMPLEDKERVEALKGASSLYYGFTTPVGVINLVTKRARNEPNASVNLSGNEFGQIVEHVDLGTKFGNNKEFGARINVVDGTLRNTVPGSKGSRSLLSTALDWNATSKLSFNFDAEVYKKETNEPAAIVTPAAVGGVITLPARPDPNKLIADSWPRNEAIAKNVLLRADYAISDNWYALAEVGRAQTRRDKRDYSEITAYNRVTGEGSLNFSLTRDLNFVNNNQRLEVGGKLSGPVQQDLTFGLVENRLYQAGVNSQAVSVPQNLYNPRPLAFIPKTSPTILNPVNTTDKGTYLMDRLTYGDFQFTVAIRKEDYQTVNQRFVVNPPTRTVYTATPTTKSYAALYKLRKDTSVYGSYIEGLEEGPLAPTTVANAGAVLPPAVSKQQELGIRSEAMPGMLGSIAYFKLERATSYTNASNFLVLDGRTEIKGVEFSFSGELNKEFSVYGSGTMLDAKLKNAATAALIGKTAEATPKEFGSILVEYRPGFVQGLSVNVGAYYTGRRFLNPLNQGEIPGYTIFTGGIAYKAKIADKRVTFQANVANAGNKDYWEAGGAGYIAVGMPRAISFVAKVDFL